ncbi:MAG: glycoside hydrolase family 2 TIM barrel-domain containing protein [Bacillota bacterium]|nr:glycoside hydrolase family 2 TIM barrel-domain containing protein [Bacillota bacterium]
MSDNNRQVLQSPTAGYIPGYPRPQFVRPEWEDLCGEWNFAFDDGDIGLREGWATKGLGGAPEQLQIRVPYSYETTASGIGDTTHHPVVWYERTVEIEAEQLTAERAVVLLFEGVDYECRVWINGQLAGSHRGGYHRFSFDITTLLEAGPNRLTVRATDRPDRQLPRGKQRWMPESFGCWYEQTTGIWKPVWLEFRPRVALDGLRMETDSERRELRLGVGLVDGLAVVPEGLGLRAVASFAGTIISSITQSLPPLERHFHLTLPLDSTAIGDWGMRLWQPGQPALYDLTLELLDSGGRVLDRVESYFGCREIRIHEGRVWLNGHPLFQRLILDQGYWRETGLTAPDEAALRRDVEAILALGFNGLRKHQKVEDERFLYWCDVLGVLVWSEMAANYSFTAAGCRAFTEEWVAIVEQMRNHPAIVCWTPFNESWGVPEIQHAVDQQNFTVGIVQLTRALDPTRPVISNDGWEHTDSDLITLHDYEASGEAFAARYHGDGLLQMLANKVPFNRAKLAFADGWEWRGEPILISEYGGIAFAPREGEVAGSWGYGDRVEDEAAFLARYAAITEAIVELEGCVGFCYTQLTDIQQEVNGLMTIDREFKIDPVKIAPLTRYRSARRA